MALAAIVDSASQLVTATPLSEPFGTGAGVTAVEVHTYTRKTDPMTRISQLVESTGASIDVPVLDHVVGLTFDYDVPAADLVDGPWRPDAASDLRWDADLLRIRTVGVTIRLESALLMSRGPAGALFANGGTARDPRAWVPDQTIRFQIAPRNLPLRRAE
jgi:hypothetical protein